MPRKSFTPEQIIAKLRQVEVLISQRHAVAGGLPGGWDLGTELLSLAQALWGYGQRPTARTETAAERE